MIKEKEFIKIACEKIHTAFPNATLEYEYKNLSDTHFVKITPAYIYDEDLFIDLGLELGHEFGKQFAGVLCFINNEDLSELNNSEIICCPKKVEVSRFSYADFFSTSGAVVHYDIKLGAKPIAVSLSQRENEDFSATKNTQYAMAA